MINTQPMIDIIRWGPNFSFAEKNDEAIGEELCAAIGDNHRLGIDLGV
jgi:hypothetical protein